MEVILKEDVPKLGHRGEVVKVAEGYGRNYLLPHKLAIEATTANRAVIEQMKQSAVRKSAVEKTAADALAQQLDGTALSFHAQSRREGPPVWFGHHVRYCRSTGAQGLQYRPAQAPAR